VVRDNREERASSAAFGEGVLEGRRKVLMMRLARVVAAEGSSWGVMRFWEKTVERAVASASGS
jgi:hypothetical protein